MHHGISIMASFRKAALTAALTVAIAAPGASANPGESFYDPPKSLRFEVKPSRGSSGERLIGLGGEFESVFRCPMEEIIDTLWDFETAPRVFKRIESVKVRSDDGTRAVTEQRTAIRVLGLSFVSNLVFENELRRVGGTSATFSFKAIELDASTRSSAGSWDLEEVAGASGPVTRVRYSVEMVVADEIPGQELALRGFAEGDTRNVVRDLAKEVERRRRSGG